LLDEHLLGDAGDRPFQFGEPQHLAIEQVEDDDHLPAPFQHPERRLHAGGGHIRRHILKLTRR
jgi:hypothetical protein